MDYPQKLPLHDHFSFNIANILDKNDDIRLQAKYHSLSEVAPDLTYIPMHEHKFYEINIIASGNSMHYINNNIYPAPPGTVFVIPPHVQHGYFSDQTTQIFHLIMDNTFISSYISLINSLKGYSFLFDIEPFLRRENKLDLFLKLSAEELAYIHPILDRLCLYSQNHSGSNRLTAEFLALNLIAELCNFSCRDTYATDNAPDYTDDIIKIMEFVSQNFKDKLNFHKIAQDNNMSYATFFRRFKKLCCMTPIQYLVSCRINEAINMMSQNKYTLTDIAITCGFYDISHFTKSFISLKGCSPTEFFI